MDKDSLLDLVNDDERFVDLLEDSLEDLYENAPSGYISSLLDGTIVKLNKTFLELIGFTDVELLGKRTLQSLLTPGGRIFFETHYLPVIRMQGAVREIALDLVCADGTVRPVLMSSVVKTDNSGQALLVRTTVFDATERRSYERQLLMAKEQAEIAEDRATKLAHVLQQTLIPPAPPYIEGLDVGAVYRPAGVGDEVGGDFYDVFATGDTAWSFVLGDVCGKGAEAAVVTALARYTTRAAAMSHGDPAAVLNVLNEALLAGPSDRFCTAVYGNAVPEAGTWRMTLALAGHPHPLLWRNGEVTEFGHTGQLLGVARRPDLHNVSDVLARGDILVFYTDGVTEARCGNEFFGRHRLIEAIDSLSLRTAHDVADAIATEVVNFQSGLPRDDIAVVVVRV